MITIKYIIEIIKVNFQDDNDDRLMIFCCNSFKFFDDRFQ